MSTVQLHDKHMTPVASPAAWYSSNILLVAIRFAQFASSITALGLLAYLVNYGDDRGFELAVSAISLTYLLVVAFAPLPLNLYSQTALAVFGVSVFALWTAASGTLGVEYGQYNCSAYSSSGSYNYYFDYYSYFGSLGTECRAGQSSIAFAAFSAFLSLCELGLLCVNVLVPMNAAFVAAVQPEGTAAHLRRFTALAIARAPGTAQNDVEAAVPVAAGASETVESAAPVTVEPTAPVTVEPTAPVTVEPTAPVTVEPTAPVVTEASAPVTSASTTVHV
ncbi:LAQU0S01e00188g1_1 [Lachancea quebecensis]|uniref:LAQU0S01e00188g1_1 n=1 Tax=Lachancea quebecensis TaxID=1654605 RepID=A0A0P1KNM7_9SACH|nr:LAQU0S01e00188g1_1 [Lachancea quebecensis]